MKDKAPFEIQTCENVFRHRDRRRIFSAPQADSLAPFEIYDPFGLRAAIVPVFRGDAEGRLYGFGTAFCIDNLGGFLTAHHVIDFGEQHSTSMPVLLLSVGVVFGTVGIPHDCFAPVVKANAFMAEDDNPMAYLRGDVRKVPTVDIASLQVSPPGPDAIPPEALPVRARNWTPQIGETVLAVGFPQLDFSELDEDELYGLLKEGMMGAYGRIIEVYDQGTSSTNRTPVFAVEGDWLPGMSGGPVFNHRGEVIGMVSRSLRSDTAGPGTGYAACFSLIPEVGEIAQSLDLENPGWCVGWGVFFDGQMEPGGFFASEEMAQEAASMAKAICVIKRVSIQIGTGEYVVTK